MFPKIVLVIAIVALLSACAAPPATNLAPTETLTATPPPTASQTSTSTPTPTSTPEATAMPEQFTTDYLTKFENVHEGTKIVAGENKNVIFGTEINSGIEQVIGMEMDGQMVRMGEWKDQDGRSFYAYIATGYDIGKRIGVTSKTAEILFGTEDKPLSVNLFKSIGKQWGMTPEEAKAKIMADGGIANFQIPTAPEVGSELAKDDYAVVWKDLPYPANFNLPIEIIVVENFDKLEKLATVKDNIVSNRKTFREDAILNGYLVDTKENGQLVIYYVNSGITSTRWVLNPKPDEANSYIDKFLRESVGWAILNAADLISKTSEGESAFKNIEINASWGKFDNLSRQIFEYNGLINYSSQ